MKPKCCFVFVIVLSLLFTACVGPSETELAAMTDIELLTRIADSDALLKLEKLCAEEPDFIAAFTELCPYYAALAERDSYDVILRQEGYRLLKDKLAAGENDTAANLARLIWTTCPEMMDIIEYDCTEIFPYLTDRELVTFLVREDLINSESLDYSWSWRLYHSPSPADALAAYAGQHSTFAALYARQTFGAALKEYGIPIVSERMESESYGDHYQAIALAQLICAASPDAVNTLKDVPNPYQNMSDLELVQRTASHNMISFFFHGPWQEPLSEKGMTYFGTICPEFAELKQRDTFTAALAEFGPAIAREMRKSGNPQESLNGWAFMELVAYLNPHLQPVLEEIINH